MRKNLFPLACLALALFGGTLAGCSKETPVTAGGEQATTQSNTQSAGSTGGQATGATQGQSGK